MLREITVTADTIDEAKQKACQELGTDMEKTQFEILQQPEKKILGLFGGSPAEETGPERAAGGPGHRGLCAPVLGHDRGTGTQDRWRPLERCLHHGLRRDGPAGEPRQV